MSTKDLRQKYVRAFVMITMKPGTSKKIVSSRKIRGIKIANSVFGRFDAVAVIEATDLEELKKIIYEMIEQHPDVIHTETLLSMQQ
ncbi:MAG: Lrp/AsnC ligand binding domain-containing protein [Candidatus Bathyarchaeota archaeon]|nr:Lrp/AsnC ligand binding domain-containing protein [Candidatus Bathyarchaeota archaeon]MCZ2845240.1 Lrp/AsnC ligand binding domain-containing protein [Candidatus Bathyarchaeota archaeon]